MNQGENGFDGQEENTEANDDRVRRDYVTVDKNKIDCDLDATDARWPNP